MRGHSFQFCKIQRHFGQTISECDTCGEAHRNGELRRQVGIAVAVGTGEHRVGSGQWVRCVCPNAGEGVAVPAHEAAGNVLGREFEQVVDVVEEAAAIYLVHEVRPNHFSCETNGNGEEMNGTVSGIRRNQEMKNRGALYMHVCVRVRVHTRWADRRVAHVSKLNMPC